MLLSTFTKIFPNNFVLSNNSKIQVSDAVPPPFTPVTFFTFFKIFEDDISDLFL